jgi:phospholipid/cholesterol/gamma-HCH transport system substrate-binding protein
VRIELPRRLRIGLGMAFVTLALGTTVVILNYGQGYYDAGYEVTATFPASSQGIFTDGGTAVKMRGINVGAVSDIEVLPDGEARLTLFIDDGVDIPTASMISIEPLSVFGPKFIRVDPGPTELTGPFLADGGDIPLGQTVVASELTEILAEATELFEHIDTGELIEIFDAVSEGVTGLGPELGRTVDAGAELLAVGADHAEQLRGFLDDVAALSAVAASRSGQILATIDSLHELVPLVVEHADDIDQLLVATTSISTDFATLLADNQAAVDSFVTGTGRFVDGIYQHGAEVPQFIDLIATFFGRLSDVIRMPGPAGTQLTALRGFISLEPCLLLGICSASAASGASATQAARADPASALVGALLGPS